MLTTCLFGLIISDIPTTSAADIELFHDAGNLTFKVDDHAALPFSIEYNNTQQSDREGGWLDDTFFFFDQSQYIHTSSGDIATGRASFPGGDPPEFASTARDLPLTLLEDGVVDKSHGTFTKVKDINGQANDVRIHQTAWNKKDEHWGIFQWTVQNLFDSDLTAVRLGLRFYACVGGDNGDDRAYWNPTDKVYYIKDSGSGTYFGFASADPGVPINMYWDGSINDLYWDRDIYDASTGSPYVSGQQNDLGSIVGWTDDEVVNSGLTIPGNEYISRSMVMAVNSSYEDLVSTIERARHFYKPRTLMISELADEGVPRVEIRTLSSVPVHLWNVSLSVDGGKTYWSGGSWDTDHIPGGGYSVWTLAGSDTFNSTQGDTLGLYNISSGEIYDEVAFGKEGRAPDPINHPSIGSISRILTSGWVHSLGGMTFGAQNTGTGSIDVRPDVVLNEVMFNPISPENGFIELMYVGDETIDIDGYYLVTDGKYCIPGSHILTANDPHIAILGNQAPGLFFNGNLSSSSDNVYLYDSQGTLLDMVGWSTAHTQNKTVNRVPEGFGAHEGYDDMSSEMAGWVFDTDPTIPLVHMGPRGQFKYCDPGDSIWFNVTITNKMDSGELFDISKQLLPGWQMEIYMDDMTTKMGDSDWDGNPDLFIGAYSSLDFSVKITIPTSGISGYYGNTTLTAQANSNAAIYYSLKLEVRFNPYLCPGKTVTPSKVNVLGTGFNEEATITLSVTGCGFGIASTMPQDVVFVVDRSDSMMPHDIDLAKNAITEYVENMSSPDKGAAEHFDSTVVLMSSLTGNYNKLKNDIKNIPGPGDLTYMGEALLEALEELNSNGKSDHTHNIILLTDGGWNGNLDPMDVAYWASENSTRIFTIGLGVGPFNELLKDIADTTGGQNFTAETAEDLRGIYIHIATIIDRVAGRDKDVTDSNPMIRDVLPPWIDYVSGSFSLAPDHIYVNSSGYTILEWNVSSILIAENWTVSFNITSSMNGFLEANNYTASRIFYTNWADVPIETPFPKTMINVVVPKPIPPILSIEVVDDGGFTTGRGNNIRLSWIPPSTPITAYYLIYRSNSQTGFDFSSPWVRTDVDNDNGVNPLRTSWNDTNAAGGVQKNVQHTFYYTIRAVNSAGKTSTTSRTVGKWTRTFPSGTSSFSLPLEPLSSISSGLLYYDMGAESLKWMDSVNHNWRAQGNGFVNSTDMEVGLGYEVEFQVSTKYTFCGMPGAMIYYDRSGFDATPFTGDADSLSADVIEATDSVVLTWSQPASMTPEHKYHVLRATTRDGFWGEQDVDYILLAELDYDILTYQDVGVTLADTEYYYMIVPVNVSTGERGTSSYSIGVWTAGYNAGYDTIGLPLELSVVHSADWYCYNIPYTVGINYYINTEHRWGWHSTRMPRGAYDPVLVMGEGYQISTTGTTKFTFIGI
jgi:hypothetical protein